MKKSFLFVLTAILFAACQESLEDKCEREAKEFTRKNCPAMIAQEIMMDSMTFERATHTIHYYYKLTGQSDRSDAYNMEEAAKMLKEGLKNTTSVQTYKNEGYNFTYTYRSEKDPKTIWLEVKLSKKDYE
jgi:ADP-ribose pyrophosphatase YjhB (NUDIX family)